MIIKRSYKCRSGKSNAYSSTALDLDRETMASFLLLITIGASYAAASANPQTFTLSRRTSSNATVALTSEDYGQMYDANVTIGGQTIPVLIDTGSSDLWVLGSDWICLNDTSNATLPRSDCNFGPTTYTQSPTFKAVEGEYLGEQLGNGRVSGALGTDDITFAGFTVSNASFGVIKNCSNTGDGINSGILGVGYPSMTSAHAGSFNTAGSNTTFDYNRTTYDNLFVQMANDGLIDPYFSITLERTPFDAVTGPGGYITLGGLPPVPHSDDFATVPVVTIPLPEQYWIDGKLQRTWWAANVDGIKYGSASAGMSSGNMTVNSKSFPAVFDTGNFFNFLPRAELDAMAKLWSPPAVRQVVDSSLPPLYAIDCNATAPELAYIIGGKDFWLDGEDLIFLLGPGQCVATFLAYEDVSYDGVITGAIVGAPFYQNVIAVHDFGKNEMRFAAKLNQGRPQVNGTAPVSTGSATPTQTGTSVPMDPISAGGKVPIYSTTWMCIISVLILLSCY